MKKTLWHESTRLSDPACGYKWGWSTVNLTAAETNSCHRVDRDRFTDHTVLFPWLDVYINDEWEKLQP